MLLEEGRYQDPVGVHILHAHTTHIGGSVLGPGRVSGAVRSVCAPYLRTLLYTRLGESSRTTLLFPMSSSWSWLLELAFMASALGGSQPGSAPRRRPNHTMHTLTQQNATGIVFRTLSIPCGMPKRSAHRPPRKPQPRTFGRKAYAGVGLLASVQDR